MIDRRTTTIAGVAARIEQTLATAITPEPWESTDDIGAEWWTVRLADGGVTAGFDGIGGLTLYRAGVAWFIEFVVAQPAAPGADERRAWLRAAIAQLAPDVVEISAADRTRIVRGAAA